MAFCSSCGTENPDGAKFCAKCGNSVAASAAPQPPAQPAAPAQPEAPAQPPAPAQTPAKKALASPKVPKPSRAKGGPDPNAPDQTQFFLAAAGVSLGSKIKRIILFILAALVVGAAIMALIQYGFLKKEDPVAKIEKKNPIPAATQPAPPPAAPVTAPDVPDAKKPAAKAKPGDTTKTKKGKTKKKKSG